MDCWEGVNKICPVVFIGVLLCFRHSAVFCGVLWCFLRRPAVVCGVLRFSCRLRCSGGWELKTWTTVCSDHFVGGKRGINITLNMPAVITRRIQTVYSRTYIHHLLVYTSTVSTAIYLLCCCVIPLMTAKSDSLAKIRPNFLAMFYALERMPKTQPGWMCKIVMWFSQWNALMWHVLYSTCMLCNIF